MAVTEQEMQAGFARRLRDGDESVLEDVLEHLDRRTRQALRARFQGKVSESDLEDAIAAALFRLWVSRREFDPAKASLSTYFYLLTRNALIDALRRQGPESVGSANPPRPAGRLAGGGELQARMKAVLRDISEPDRRVLLKQEPDADLAASLDISEAALRVRRSRLKQRLRLALQSGGKR